MKLEGLPVGMLLSMVDSIDGIFVAVTKANTYQATKVAEKKLTDSLIKAWKSAAQKGIDEPLGKLLSSSVTQKSLNTYLNSMGVIISNPLTKEQIKVIEARLTSIWKTAKRIAAKEAGASFSFRLVDKDAVAAISRHQVFWVNNMYNEHLSSRIRAVSKDVMLEQGLSRKEAGKALRKALQREMGLVPGGKSRFAASIPARFAGNPDLYFEGVASTASHQSRTFAKVTAFKDAGVTTYKLLNPMDSNTGKQCLQLHGQVFTVATAVGHMNKILGAQDPSDVKDTAPWLSGSKIQGVLDGAALGSKDATDRLQAAGAILPPFHSKCRTEPVVLK